MLLLLVLLGFIMFYWVVLGFTGVYYEEQGFSRFFLV